MSQETYNYWSLIPSLAGSIISLGVGIVVFCYTKETQQLCRLSAEQLAISRRQGEQFAEQIAASTRPFVMCEVESKTIRSRRQPASAAP